MSQRKQSLQLCFHVNNIVPSTPIYVLFMYSRWWYACCWFAICQEDGRWGSNRPWFLSMFLLFSHWLSCLHFYCGAQSLTLALIVRIQQCLDIKDCLTHLLCKEEPTFLLINGCAHSCKHEPTSTSTLGHCNQVQCPRQMNQVFVVECTLILAWIFYDIAPVFFFKDAFDKGVIRSQRCKTIFKPLKTMYI